VNLVGLLDISLIEPIFVSLTKHNAVMGDWLIREFIRRGLYAHSALVGKLVLCDHIRLVDRIRIMLEKTIEVIASASNN